MLSELRAWERKFGALQRHVASSHTFETTASNTLHRWIQEQRIAGIQGRLLPERRRRLLELGFTFAVDSGEIEQQTWDLHVKALRAQVHVSPSYKPSPAKLRCPPLDRWLRRQLVEARIGNLPQARIQQLFDAAPHLFRRVDRADLSLKK